MFSPPLHVPILPDVTRHEQAYPQWYQGFARTWKQGEHVALIGQTGSGKTTLARDILSIRDYVVVLAVKRHDDTLASFTRPSPAAPASEPYATISRWPPAYNQHRVLFVARPGHLRDTAQGDRVYAVMNGVFQAGGWCIMLDDTGYITGVLGLKRPVTVLLTTGRSHGISVVTAMTQPTSMVQQIPSETLRQVRHYLIFGYRGKRDRDAIAAITGLHRMELDDLLDSLAAHDFLAVSHGAATIVRYDRGG